MPQKQLIQWNNLLELRNIEGSLDFLAKDFQVNQRNQNSALLNLIGLLDIQSFFDGYDGSSTDEYIKFKRGSGSMIFSQKYGRVVDDFSFEADFGNMDWSGFIIKDNSGFFEELDLELSLKLNLQENIRWYAAIFGGLGVAADASIGDDLRLISDSAVLSFGADSEVTLTHVADTGLLLSATDQLQFGDSGTYIHQSADGVLDLVSDTEIEINATTIDVNGNLDVSGTIVSAGTITGTLATAAQGNITSLGTLTALTVDDVAVDGKVITMTGSSGDTATFTVAAVTSIPESL
mgnify:CR=1 FL=1